MRRKISSKFIDKIFFQNKRLDCVVDVLNVDYMKSFRSTFIEAEHFPLVQVYQFDHLRLNKQTSSDFARKFPKTRKFSASEKRKNKFLN